MVLSLRGRLVCFYCGCRSTQIRKPNISRWHCKKCEAVNHLDENGEITDPPAESFTNARYAQSVQRPTSPLFDGPDESLFCQTCLKNQHIVSESVASYFPSIDAPNYADYEKHFDKYREELEQRYPQSCEECEPRVVERIRAAGYAAKADHLRRTMQRTRGEDNLHNGSSWRSVLVFLGGAAWFASLAGQAMSNGMGLWMPKEVDGLVDEKVSPSSDCLWQAMRGSELGPGCATLAKPVARVSIVLGLISLWWNPRLQKKLKTRGGRLVGTREYYKLQAFLLICRWAAWAYSTSMTGSDLDSQITAGIHCSSLFLCALLNVMAFRSISLDYTPRVVFQDSPGTLISRKPQLDAAIVGLKRFDNFNRQPNPYSAQSNGGIRPFSINDLAPLPQHEHQPPYQPPTPPPDDNDDEAMDWTPSQQANLRPAALYRPSSSIIQQPEQSPFHGHLPADVVSMERRLRNPPNRPTFRKASETQKQNFFKNLNKQSARDENDFSDAGTEYEPSVAESIYSPTPAHAKFADPTFYTKSDSRAETGLERLLESTFSLDDEPARISAVQQRQAQAWLERQTSTTRAWSQWHRLPVVFSLLVSCFLWTNLLGPFLAANREQLRLATLLVAALTSIRSLVIMLRQDRTEWSGSDMIVFISQLAYSIALTVAIGEPSAGPLSIFRSDALEIMGLSLFTLMAVQELWTFSVEVRASSRTTEAVLSPAPDPGPTTRALTYSGPVQQPSMSMNDDIASPQVLMPQIQPRVNKSTPGMTQRSTRSRTELDKSAVGGRDFGGLSLGGNDWNSQVGGMGSFNLGQAHGNNRNRNGMW